MKQTVLVKSFAVTIAKLTTLTIAKLLLICVSDVKGAHFGGTDSSLPAAAQVRTNPQRTHDGQQQIANVITELAHDPQ